MLNMDELIKVINKCKNDDELKYLFDVIFTHSELDDLEKRIKIIQQLLAKELSQREIAKKLNVSIFNISRGVKLLKNNSNINCILTHVFNNTES